MRRTDNNPCLPPGIRGFSLIEALVALVVLSVGLLGVAGLQMSGMRSVQGAQYRSDSSRLAEGLLDRMRANMPGVRKKNYSTINAATVSGWVDCSSTTCEPANIAKNDLIAWYSELKSLLKLPTGTTARASVTCTPASCDTDAVITVAVAWRERNEDKAAAEDDADKQLVTKSYILNTVL